MQNNICNLDQLSAMTGGDKDVMKEFIKMYLNDTPSMMDKVLEANAKQFYVGEDSVSWCCHKMAPQLSYMGMNLGFELIKKVENTVKELNGAYPELDTDLATIKDLCDKSYVELNDFIDS